MLFWLILIGGGAALLWYMVAVPGRSHAGALEPLTADEKVLVGNLRGHVKAVASREHNLYNKPADLEAAARHVEFALFGMGYRVEEQRFEADRTEVRNIEVEVPGGA